MRNELQTSGGAAGGGLGASLLACLLLGFSSCGTKPPPAPATPAPAKAAAAKLAASTNQVVATDLFVGVFDMYGSPDFKGSDPFFPESERIHPPPPKPKEVEPDNKGKEGNVPLVVPDTALVLKAILGAPPRRVAAINRTTFEEGEEADVKCTHGVIKVKCLEIRDDSVRILADGKEKELRFRER